MQFVISAKVAQGKLAGSNPNNHPAPRAWFHRLSGLHRFFS
jgi:hypothetical protein